MREILFRGKRIDNGEWVEGYYKLCGFCVGTIEEEIYPTITPFNQYGYIVDTKTVGQFTGLTDKNGKKIFEGDIWKRGDICGAVRWDDEEARFIVSYEIGGIEYQNAVCERKLKTIEIIGNIHDNPELLEGE